MWSSSTGRQHTVEVPLVVEGRAGVERPSTHPLREQPRDLHDPLVGVGAVAGWEPRRPREELLGSLCTSAFSTACRPWPRGPGSTRAARFRASRLLPTNLRADDSPRSSNCGIVARRARSTVPGLLRRWATATADVTVVISCFNYGRYLAEAVESALGQEGGAPQVVVVDDGSTEPAHARRARAASAGGRGRSPGEPRRLRRAQRGPLSRRDAVRARAGRRRPPPPRRAAAAAPAARARPELGFAYGRMRFFGDWEGVLRFPPYDPYALLYRHTIGLSALARREVFEDTGGFDEEFLHFEDWELWLDALEHGWRGEQVDAVTVEYRRHGGRSSARTGGATAIPTAGCVPSMPRCTPAQASSPPRASLALSADSSTASTGVHGRSRPASSRRSTGCTSAHDA